MRQKGLGFLNWLSLSLDVVIKINAISVFFVHIESFVSWGNRDEDIPVGNRVAQIRVAPPLTFIGGLGSRSDFNHLLTDHLHQMGHNHNICFLLIRTFASIPSSIIKTEQIILLLHLE
jgi:hypothetical protein